MATITPQGITGTTLLQYLQRIQDGYLNIDPDWNINPESPDGQQIAIWSEQLAMLDEAAQYAYMSRDPKTATGQALWDIGTYAGISPRLGTFSTANVVIQGVNGAVVPQGSQVRHNLNGTLWQTTRDATIEGQETEVPVVALQRGALEAGPNTLTIIATPALGWQRVTNPVGAFVGNNNESDELFRERRNLSVALPGANQVDNILAAVYNVDGVQRGIVYENQEDVTDSRGLGPHSIAIFVQGGDEDAVADAIAPRKNPGCGMNSGSGFPNRILRATTTPLGNPVAITYFRPELIPVYVDVTVVSDSLSEANASDIAQAIVDFSISGYMGGGTQFTRRGFNIGETVSAGRLYTPVNAYLSGRGYVDILTVGTTEAAGDQIVSTEFNELPVFSVENINVRVNP